MNINDNKYDVVIVGAGPAGLECAYQFKNTNYSVLIIEGEIIIGEKLCAGGLTNVNRSDYNLTEQLIMIQEYKAILNRTSYDVKINYSMGVGERSDIAKYQLDKIDCCPNIRLIKGVTVKNIYDDRVATSDGEYLFKYLVGADGVNSLVRRHLGLKKRLSASLCFNSPVIKDDLIFSFDPKEIRPGYIWAFPHKTYTSLGIYFYPQWLRPDKAKDLLVSFADMNGYSIPEDGIKGGAGNYLYKGSVFNNIYLAGEASGLVSIITGEGILYAIISGRDIGQKIINNHYKMHGIKKILVLKKRHEFFVKLYEKCPALRNLIIKNFVYLLKKKWFQHYMWEL